MKKISIITDKGLEIFEEKDKNKIEEIIEERRTLIHTFDDKEHLGIFYVFNTKWKSFNLRGIQESDRVISIGIDKVKEIFQSIE